MAPVTEAGRGHPQEDQGTVCLTTALSRRRCSMDARVSMSRASLREVAQATLGAWAAGLRKVLNSPFIRVAIPVCSERSHSVARSLNRTCGLAAGKHVVSTSRAPSLALPAVTPVRVRSLSATLLDASSTAWK